MKKILSFICIITTLLIGCTDTKDISLSQSEKIEDFKYLYKVIEEGYPYLEVNKRVNNVDWLANKEKYLERIKNTKNDEEFISEMTSILSDLNNGHTHTINDESIYEFFKEIYTDSGEFDFLEDEKVVDRYKSIGTTSENNKSPIVKKDVTVKDVIKNKVGYMHLPQMYINEEDIKFDMEIIGEYINTLENHQALIIDIRGNSGGNDAYWRNIVKKLITEDITSTGYVLARYKNEVMINYYDKLGLSFQNINKLPKEVLENAPEEVTKDFNLFFESKLTIPSDKTSKFKGNIYLLVDDIVYSSAESFAIFCKQTGFATLIGERTGGDGGGVTPILFNLENSGLIVRMTTDMFLTGDGVCNEEFKTTPDYEVVDVKRRESIEDDKCIQKVLELEKIKGEI
ncbi:peptidase S41 [Romboutsia weinsteinii]|uniref:Peptidase S41 n=1 Tax=Romboutsia weinsteinii TaxID=2020949 RepID=A0A371J1L1_9FIRM|nr:S41 family peptidase [Romboutsia weinsteinii]RDY26556.1 peptidase S41 [Romboutsia weinsteinii]